MNSSAEVARPHVLADVVPAIGGRELVRDVVLVCGSAAFVGAAAQVAIHVPGTPVPVTGQTFAVLLTGAALGSVRGILGMLLYLAAGVAGIPWFAEGTSGHDVLFGATGGYLLGFILAALVVGALAARGGDRTPLRTIATMTLGTLVIYALGVPFLMASLDIGLVAAFEAGVRPFLVGDGLKVLLAAGLLPATWKLLSR